MVEDRLEEEFVAPLDDPREPDDFLGLLTEDQMLAKLRAAVAEAGSQKDWADAHGASRQLLCDVLQGNRNIRGLIAAALGYRAVTRFEPIGDDE